VNGPQDLGGQMGFGPIAPEPDEPMFHADWEKRALGPRHRGRRHGPLVDRRKPLRRENRTPSDYYGSSYYEIWIKGLETLLLRHGFVTPGDLSAARPVDPAPTPRRVLHADAVPALIARGGPCDRPMAEPPRFSPGARVRTRNINPTGHTRLPRYARGRLGVIAAARGGFVFPDDNASDGRGTPQHLYTVVFAASELWGPQGDPLCEVSIDAWESYLEPA